MSKYKRKSSGSVFKKILVVFLVIGAIASLGALLSVGNNVDVPKKSTTTNSDPGPSIDDNFKTVYLVPSRDWASDESGYAAWCFGSDGVPAPGHISGTYNETVGAVEFNVPAGYTQLLFIDLKSGTAFEGNWDNVRAQTSDLTLPGDENVYYHQYANEWRSDSTNTEPEIIVTTEETVVYAYNVNGTESVLYVFNVFTDESTFIAPSSDFEVIAYQKFVIPAGYTHCIFIENLEGQLSWDDVLSQSEDLLIPTDGKIVYNYETAEWQFYTITTETQIMCYSHLGAFVSVYAFNANNGVGNFIEPHTTATNEPDMDYSQYYFTIPGGNTHVIFVRHNSDEYNWDTKLDQSNDLLIPQDSKILYNYNEGVWEDTNISEE